MYAHSNIHEFEKYCVTKKADYNYIYYIVDYESDARAISIKCLKYVLNCSSN